MHDVTVTAAWCDLRGAIRHFRADRILCCRPLAARCPGYVRRTREEWLASDRRASLFGDL